MLMSMAEPKQSGLIKLPLAPEVALRALLQVRPPETTEKGEKSLNPRRSDD